jgi:hypothetical protein
VGEEIIEGEEIGNNFIAVVMRDFVVESGVWEWKGILRCHFDDC